MIGFKDMLHSERGAFCIAVLILATVLVVIGKLEATAWIDFMKWLGGAFVASKTVTSAVETYVLKKPRIPDAKVVSDQPQPPSS